MLNSFFLNPAGLVTALVLIPFLLLYLIRPKPRRERIPSLLFLMRDTGKTNINSFLRNFLKDLLLILHLLILTLLILAAARPFLNVPQTFLADQTVIVLDTSASMHADGRFDHAIDLAEAHLGRKNTIISVTNTPTIIAERVSASEAKKALELLTPEDTTTALADALRAATPYAGAGSRVVVISDFLPTSGDLDYDTAADLLEAQGAKVTYLPVTDGSENVGIIDLLVGPVTSKLWVKNYEARPIERTLSISDAKQQLLLGPGESKEITFNTPPGVAKITLERAGGADDLSVDDTVWTSTPAKNTVKLLIITNNKRAVEQSHLLTALKVIQQNFPTKFDIQWAEPPKMPKLDHDVYLFDQANLDFILPGYIKKLKEKVVQGASLIIIQDDPFGLDWQGLLPVAPANQSAGSRQSITGAQSSLTQDIEFGQASTYRRVTALPGATTLASAGDDPLITLQSKGKGHVLYYGLDDTKASFSSTPSYPVFWRRLFDKLTNRPSLENLNLRTGAILTFPRPVKVKTPEETTKTSLLHLTKAGLYTLPDRVIAANLLSSAESDIATKGNVSAERREAAKQKAEKAPLEITDWFLWAALALLLLELFYVKYRGDF